MCGFAGFLIDETHESVVSNFSVEQRRRLLNDMGSAIEHRGPDQNGEWLSADGLCGFSHRRLSIVDLSQSGQQPMESHCGRYVMVYNGEVYNFKEIAKQLANEGVQLKGGSDTEVVLEAIALWGLAKTLTQMHGMFSLAIYDNESGDLSFARDRLGEKPLYLGSHDGQIIFASELKSFQSLFTYRLSEQEIIKLPRKPGLNCHAVGLYLQHGYVPAPYCIFENIYKLPAAHTVKITRQQRSAFIRQPNQWLSAFEPYWSLSLDKNEERASQKKPESDVKPVLNQGQQLDQQLDQQLRFQSTLESVVEREMHADVPLGAFLSGGVDSSTIVAIMQKIAKDQGGDAVRTFSIGFEQEEFNEAPFAAAVAKHLDTQHYEQIVTAQDAKDVIPNLGRIYDEPFADSSQIPTFLVSQLARSQVTVSLSGDGGDELFGGYERYQWAQRIWQKVAWLPAPARRVIASILKAFADLNTDASPKKVQYLAAKFERLSAMLSADDRQAFYRILISAGVNAQNHVIKNKQVTQSLDTLSKPVAIGEHFLHQMMYLDIHSYLPDDILTKVDRASMAVSLESRVPLLDHELVEQAWQLRDTALNKNAPAKQVLRNILYQSVPKELIERPKKGFAIPLAQWLRGDLQSWADDLLDYSRLKREDVFDAESITLLWNEFKNGKVGSEHLIWSLLMFQLWYEEWYQ